ncbi:MAG: hypothetical protein ACTHOJ_06105 [Sphingomonas oligoaromativorans]|jgi:hypothetical protein|uniref:hypothetical protein n=1 Tax=Sphingomonas oligoaromativorans TaxID=575322 RepID=UPI00141F5432|nr:hypothetical protein [Sphingomonas oligoaromativorans]NIJ34758.1 hypothetical protein [Sphingomonas oligoaromativorans]
MKKALLSALILIAGLGTGGAGAFATSLVMADRHAQAERDTRFVSTGPIIAPLVFADGRLSGYVTFEGQIEVSSEQAEKIRRELPLLLDAVNMRTYRTPMASGPDGLVPGVDAFRRVLLDAAVQTFGRETVRRAIVTQATPA